MGGSRDGGDLEGYGGFRGGVGLVAQVSGLAYVLF